MKDYTIAHHAYDERTVELRKWCNDNKGRTLALCKRIYSHSTGIHPYKSGKLVITDELWSRIKEEMKYVESHESKVKTPYISVTKTRNIIADGNIYAQAIDGLSKDRGRKAFSEFVGIEVTAENLRSKELRDLIIINYPKYLKALGRGTEYRIKSSILREEIDQWLLTDESIKRRMFLFIYPLVSKTKIASNALSCIYVI